MTHAAADRLSDVLSDDALPIADAVAAELDAMQAIAAALARVPDPQARLRVLRWAADRFQPAAAAALPQQPAEAAAPAAIASADASLSIDSLHDLFDAPLPIDTLDDVSGMFETPVRASAARAAAAPKPASEPRKQPREEPARLDTLVRGFASELQRLAMEWQSA
jgi:hypothetical protein